jgi:hypothetical protein
VKSSNYICLVGLRFVLRSQKESWGFVIYFYSIELFWGSCIGVMLVRGSFVEGGNGLKIC